MHEAEAREGAGEPPDGRDDRIERRPEALAAVRGDEHEVLVAGRRPASPRSGCSASTTVLPVRWIRDSATFSARSARRRALRRHEVRVRHEVDDAAVHLLGERLLEISRSKPGLDVPDAHAPVEGGDGRAERRRRVPLDEQPLRGVLDEHAVEGGEGARGELVGRLVGAHEVEVHVGPDLEEVEDLVEHLAVLGRRADDRFEA